MSTWKTIDLPRAIQAAINEPDPALSNQKITFVHYLLSEALRDVLGPTAGANFHSWAVWGSQKAGVTIRQEDLDSAIRNAMSVAGLVGLGVGILVAGLCIRLGLWLWPAFNIAPGLIIFLLFLGGLLGATIGALTGRAIARHSRAEAACLILAGNRMVLEDIGGQTARFVSTFQGRTFNQDRLQTFLKGFAGGKTEAGGQALLKQAFQAYAEAMILTEPEKRRQACYFANCLAILHEHIRLQPYITQSLPWIIRRCVTQRMMTYSVGDLTLSVAEAFSAHQAHDQAISLTPSQKAKLLELLENSDRADQIIWPKTVSATNWTSLNQRMRYIWELFSLFHLDTRVLSAPFPAATSELLFAKNNTW